jgi:hypothetical protein
VTDVSDRTELGSYVYGVARDLDPATVTAVSGVAGSPVRAVSRGALTALVSTVALAEFGAPGLRRNFEDLGWLERTARAHHAVLAAAVRDGPVVPLRLATIYHGDDGVRALLAERGAIFDAALRRVQGRTEWGLKAYLDPAQHPASTADHADPGSSGTAYLRRRRAQLHSGEEVRHAAARQAETIHRAVSAAAEAARRYPPQDGRVSGESREMVLNAAYLLAGTGRASLDEAVDQAGTWPLRVEWTGPWVPYSFVEVEVEPGP